MTFFLIGGRAGGKTTQALRWLVDNDGLLIVTSQQEVKRLTPLIPKKFQDGRTRTEYAAKHIVAVNDVKRQLAGNRRNLSLAVDNLDLVLSQLFGGHYPVDFVIATGNLIDPADALRGLSWVPPDRDDLQT